MKAALAALALAVSASADAGAQVAFNGPGALLRGLDTITGRRTDIEIDSGTSASFGRLEIALKECRYEPENPASNSFAYLTIREADAEEPVFDAWMISSAPALSALDHPRYDVWLIRCRTIGGDAEGG